MTENPAPLRVFMTVDAVGGVWTYAMTLVNALTGPERQRRVEFLLACMGPPPSAAQRHEAAAVAGVQLVHGAYRLEWMDDPWDDIPHAGRWLLERAAEFEPDVVHLNGYVHAALEWPAPVVVVGHSCVLSWWQAVRGEAAPADWMTYRNAVARGLARAHCVIAPTHVMLEALERHYGLIDDGRVIANGTELERFAPGTEEPIVVSAGRLWDEAKNFAALDVAAAHIPWPIYVAGNSRHPHGDAVVPRVCKLLGSLTPDELAEWFGRAAIYALPARYEPFGLSALEAAAAGCALVLGDIPSLREVWGNAAVFVDPNQPVALATAIRTLIDDPGKRRFFAAAATARARSFTAERMASRYAEVYAEVIAAHGAARAVPPTRAA